MANKIDEHQAPSKDESLDKQDKENKEAQVIKMVEKLLEKAKRFRASYDQDWVENYQFYRGKHWKEKRPSYRHSEVLNLTRSAIQNVIAPIMTDTRPNIETVPEEPSDFDFSEVMTHILRSKWDRKDYSRVVVDAIIDASIYGTSISEVPWNKDEFYGIGDYEFNTIDPLYFFPDPSAQEINHPSCNFVIYAEPKDISEVKRLYPDKASQIKADVLSEAGVLEEKRAEKDPRVQTNAANADLVETQGTGESNADSQVVLIQCWMNDDEVIEEKIEKADEDGNVTQAFKQMKKYPRGRKIVIAGKTLLEDIDNPYADGKFPFARYVDNQMPREFWGDGEVRMMKSTNMMIDKIMSYILDVLILTGNPIWKVPNGSGIDAEQLINAPGLVIPYNDGFEPRREAGTQLQPYIIQTLDRLVNLFEKESGINEVSQGATPSSNASGVAIERLQEAAQSKIRMKSRNLETFLNQAGRLQVSRILQFYTEPRVIRLTDTPEAARYFKFHVEEQLDETGQVQAQLATITPYVVDEQGNPIEGQPREFDIKGQLDVRIITGTELPFARATKAAKARELFQLGVIDEEDLLEAMEWPRKEKILKKLNQRKQAEAEALAMQAQQAGPQGAK